MTLKIRCVQMQIFPKEIERNARFILNQIDRAVEQGIDIILFPELCLSGYLIGDYWERPAFLKECQLWQQEIIKATTLSQQLTRRLTVVFGAVLIDETKKGEDGRVRKYNGAIVAQNGQALKQPALNLPYAVKTLLPNYREFDESRYFFDTRKLALERRLHPDDLLAPFEVFFNKKNKDNESSIKLGVVLCEDSWSDDYSLNPQEILVSKGCQLIINLSCSPFTAGKSQKREKIFSSAAQKLSCPIIYVNSTGIQNNGKTLFTFDGSSACYSKTGGQIYLAPSFESCNFDFKWDSIKGLTSQNKKIDSFLRDKSIAEKAEALRFGVREFLKTLNIQKIVIGVSGGVDSAVVAALYASVLPSENILLVNMPSQYNSDLTKNAAADLAKNLGCLYCSVGIDESVSLTKKQISHLEVKSFKGDLTYKLELSSFHLENVQARDRSSRILAAIASAFEGVFTCNANKTEMVIGYSTLYGDLGGFLAVLGDLWKYEVYELGRYLNSTVFQRQVIPEIVFKLIPSAELSLEQAVEEGKGDPLIYPYHDKLFRSWMQWWNPVTPEEILEWYKEGTLNKKLEIQDVDVYKIFSSKQEFVNDLEKYWQLFNSMAVAKRIQAPPVLAVSSRAFGFDYRESQDKPFYSTKYFQMKKDFLATSYGLTGPSGPYLDSDHKT